MLSSKSFTLGSTSSNPSVTTGGSGGGSSNPLHGVDIAAKFAEFKAKHLNNRDVTTMFKRKKVGEEEGDEGLGEGDPPEMRAALVNPDEDYADADHATSRGSMSGAGSAAGSSSAALKYVSNMFRSKFNGSDSAEKPPAGKGGIN